MPFHFCADELMALMLIIPGLAALAQRFHAWRLRRNPAHQEHCHRDEAVHIAEEKHS